MMTHHSHNEQNNTQCGGAELRRPRVPSAHYVTDHGHDVYHHGHDLYHHGHDDTHHDHHVNIMAHQDFCGGGWVWRVSI